LILIITLLAWQKYSLANVLLFICFTHFSHPLSKQLPQISLKDTKLLDSLCRTKGKHLFTADGYKSLCTCVKLVCTTLQSAISPNPS